MHLVLIWLFIALGTAYGITWDFSGGDTQGWTARHADGRRARQEVSDGVWRILPAPFGADESPLWWATMVSLVSPDIGHESALFDRVRARLRVVGAPAFQGSLMLNWVNPANRYMPKVQRYFAASDAPITIGTGTWHEVSFSGLRDGADCGTMYVDGAYVPCYLDWVGELLQVRIDVPTCDYERLAAGAGGVAAAVEVDWIQLTGVEEQLEGELPPPEVRPGIPSGTLFEATRYAVLPVPNPGRGVLDRSPGEALVDVNRDGHADVVALWRRDAGVGEEAVRRFGWFVAHGDGGGSFPTVAHQEGLPGYGSKGCALGAADIDAGGNAYVAISVGYEHRVLVCDEGDGWTEVALSETSGLRVMGVGDADGDGAADIWFNDAAGNACVLLDGSGQMRCWRPSAASHPAGVDPEAHGLAWPIWMVHNLGRHGVAGAAWPREGDRWVVGYLDAQGEAVEVDLGPAPSERLLGLADLDGDRDLDMLLYREKTLDPSLHLLGLHVLHNQGDGTWREEEWMPDARLPCLPTLTDVNGDGLIDVVWADATLYEPGVMVAVGRPGELPRIEGRYVLQEGYGGPVLAGDVNGDSRTDLVVLETQGYEGHGVHVLLNRGDMTAVVDERESSATPTGFWLGPGYPNPFNPQTLIPVQVPVSAAAVKLEVYDILGRTVRRLVSGTLAPGLHRVPWDGRDESGATVAAGVYLLRLEAEGRVQVGKMVRVE